MYLLDANTYIQAKNLYYGMDICPAYWDFLDATFLNGDVCSINQVYRELTDGNDELKDWVKERKEHFINNDDDATQTLYTHIAQHLFANDYNANSRDNFLEKADAWIIAKAAAIGATVVSLESLAPQQSKRVKVPNVCNDFGVDCINTFEFLRRVNAKFVVGG
ncbi:uncharacterized protein DUF4411 [Idiomarina fontislapidosi]|uniref:DUF4411 domain-containing protein n=1 Tax=Idiomarina fontislapidosi TaxID=263723 RepID=A0A432XDG8_9GAMM|nr:DUF4411 family protein [Idiomarina fontislapidosi]PYE29954.1 uncharacterized protein DUF4411 [Idiomarina fontislapidosi]RUO46781.1 DUF4411 domain-containing protein [Idiomarina fontislapidosi]